MVNRTLARQDTGLGILLLRKVLHLTQKDLSDAVGITIQTLSLIENGKYELSKDIALKFWYQMQLLKDSDVLDDYQRGYIKAFTDEIAEKYLKEQKVVTIADVLAKKRKQPVAAMA